MDKFRDGDLVCVACRMDDCDGVVAGFSFAAISCACEEKARL
jgi:hypothetical protein